MAARSFSIDRAEVTGRDTYLLVEALTFTVEALSGLPIELRPDNNVADMKRLVGELVKQMQGLPTHRGADDEAFTGFVARR